MKESKELIEVINKSSNILITTHRTPDFDAIGSSIGLYWIIKGFKDKSVTMAIEDKPPYENTFLEGIKRIEQVDLSDKEFLNKFDLIIILDANRKSRITKGDFPVLPEQKIVVIDHHTHETDLESVLYIKRDASSTSEILFDLFSEDIDFSIQTARAFLSGIYDDTNGFSIKTVTKHTYEIVAKLVEDGAVVSEVAEKIKTYDESVLNALKVVINNLKFDEENKYAYSYITRDVYDLLEMNSFRMDVVKNLLIDILLGREGYPWGFIVNPDEDGRKCRISFRSRTTGVNVRKIAELFGGGGHDAASGATIETTDAYEALALTRNKISEFIKNEKGAS